MTHAAARTAHLPMLVVALEQKAGKEVRIVHDDLAGCFLPFPTKLIYWLLRPLPLRYLIRKVEKIMPGMWSGFLCRKRYIDEKASQAVDDEIQNIVNLGAGYDTRAYRLASLRGAKIWEVDQQENIEGKRKGIIRTFGEVPGHVNLMKIDFDADDLAEKLSEHGYTMELKTFFIWEAVSQYLPEQSVRKTFEFLATATSESRLVFTYIQKNFLLGEEMYGQEFLYEDVVAKEKTWQFGFKPNDVKKFLNEYGWRIIEHCTYTELADRYVVSERNHLLCTDIELIVFAEKIE